MLLTFMPPSSLLSRLLFLSWALAVSCCECEPREHSRPEQHETSGDAGPSSPTVYRRTAGEPFPHHGEDLSPIERRIADKLIAHVTKFYPVMDSSRETIDDYFEREDNAPQSERLRQLIRRRSEEINTWNACLLSMNTALKRDDLSIRNGTPPMFYIPSFQVVLHGKTTRGDLTMVFRLSMLAPVHDYYEHTRDPVTREVQMSVVPTPETETIARTIRSVIATHYPGYRELPPRIGSTQVPGVMLIDVTLPTSPTGLGEREATLAELLFEDTRGW